MGKGPLADGGQHYFFRHDLDSGVGIGSKNKHFHLLMAWSNRKVLCWRDIC